MNMNRIINMVINIIMRRTINAGINKGIGAMSRKGGAKKTAASGQAGAGAPAHDGRAAAKRARQAARITRRLR